MPGKSALNGRKSVSWYFVFKRMLDFSLALILLIILSPFMGIIAILIKLDSSGDIIFRQKRVGTRRVYNNGTWKWETKDFYCLKFRTMFQHSDPALHQAYVTALIQNDTNRMDELQNGHQAVHKLVNDPRVTKIGHFLRQSSMDELPQLFNVLRGQMSLVGPRPAIQYEVELYKCWHKDRFDAWPGITGLQQVMARGTADFDEQVKYDLEYIRSQTIWLDLKILFLTPLVVIRHRGAY